MSPETPDDPVRRFFGWALVAVGGLWMGLCGLCTLAVWGASLGSAGNGVMLLLPLVVGGIGAAPGLGLFLLGRMLLKPSFSPAGVSKEPPSTPGGPA